jgi:OOP family OmpA-OmpF porin
MPLIGKRQNRGTGSKIGGREVRYCRLLLGGLLLVAASVGSVAHAQTLSSPLEPGAFYLGLKGGWTNLVSQTDSFPALKGIPGAPAKINMNYDGAGLGPAQSGNWNFPQHLVAGGRFGYQWGPWSIEEELDYRHNTLFHFFHQGASQSGDIFHGAENSQAALTNLIYEFGVPDFTLGGFNFHSPVTLHVGAGVGVVKVLDTVSLSPLPGALSPLGSSGGILLHGDTWTFGYDGVVGVRYEINPNVFIDLDYGYLGTPQLTFHNKATTAQGAGVLGGLTYNSSYQKHDCVVSLVFKLSPPSSPPPLAASAPQPRTGPNVYLVFFDWDSSTITPEGMQIVARAADQYKAGGRVRLEISGYTDLSGSAAYNQRLSERRASAVAEALAHLGVQRGDMAVSGHGIDNPRIPTPLGVREPQNRRVEIVFT